MRALRELLPKRQRPENPVAEADDLHAALNELRSRANFYTSAIRHARDRLRTIDIGTTSIELEGSEIKNVQIDASSPSIELRSHEGRSSTINNLVINDPILSSARKGSAQEVVLQSSLPDGCALQPSSTAVYSAVLNVTESLIVTPSSYRLQFNVNYGFSTSDDIRNNDFKEAEVYTNTVSHEIAIRPSVYSVMFGSCIGGFVGSVARLLQISFAPTNIGDQLQLLAPLQFGGTVAVAVILSAIAVIFLARKSDAQSFISVEDFWGGILIGFMIGYTGTSFFAHFTGITPSGYAPPSPGPPAK